MSKAAQAANANGHSNGSAQKWCRIRDPIREVPGPDRTGSASGREPRYFFGIGASLPSSFIAARVLSGVQ